MKDKDKIAPSFWFSEKADEAARCYVSIFPDSRIDRVTTSPAATPQWAARGERAKRVMEAMMKMVKLDIAGLQRAYAAAAG